MIRILLAHANVRVVSTKKCLKNWILSEYNRSPTHCEVCLGHYTINFETMFHRPRDQIPLEINRGGNVSTSVDNIDYADPSHNIGEQIVLRRRNEMRNMEHRLQDLLRYDKDIKDRIICGSMTTMLIDVCLVAVYFSVCEYSPSCKIDVITIGILGTFISSIFLMFNLRVRAQNLILRQSLIM